MRSLFESSSARWVHYDRYELKKAEDGFLYVTLAASAKPVIYDPLKDSERMVLDALSVGLLSMNRKPEAQVRDAVMDFVTRYGLLGLMTALPTTALFMDYESVYLPKNRFIKEESMVTDDYLSRFFPFDKLEVRKSGMEYEWDIQENRDMMALALTFSDYPVAVSMGFQRQYAERYDWVAQQFKDWAFTLVGKELYYEDYDRLDEAARDLYRKGMAAFDGNAPSYHIELRDCPTIVWDFHSLSLNIQMTFACMLADSARPLRLCRQCAKAFVASRPSAVFCGPECKNRYNVYKSRAKQKDNQSQ